MWRSKLFTETMKIGNITQTGGNKSDITDGLHWFTAKP